MRRLSRTQGKANQPEAPTRVAVAASKSSKRVTKATDSRKSITGAEPADAFSDALQRHEPKRPATASSTARRGSRVAVGAPSPPKAEKDTKEGEAKTASRLAPTDKDERERGAGGDGDGEESGEQSEEEEDGDASGFYGVFVQTKRCETLCRDLGITTRDIRRMKRKYDANDMYNTGEITQAEFFFMINETRRPLTVGIFTFARVSRDVKYLSFDQYLLCVVSFATLTKPELFQYVFDLYDTDKSGSLDEREFACMSRELQSPQFSFPANVQTAIRMLGGQDGVRYRGQSDDGLVDFDQFMKFARNFPVAFYPIINMQKNVRDATQGESFWSSVVARKLRIQQLVSYMRAHDGAVPLLTVREKLASIFSSEISAIRHRAGTLYALEMAQRRKLGWD